MATSRTLGPTREQLENLLARLGADDARAGEALERLRMRLELLFAANGCGRTDELVDRTLDILMCRMDEGESIVSPTGYAIGVARRLLMEDRRKRSGLPIPLEEGHGIFVSAAAELPASAPNPRVGCLERCLGRIAGGALFLEYHDADGTDASARRQEMARREGLSPGGLRKRVHTIRLALERCVTECEHAGHRPGASAKGNHVEIG